MTCKKLVLIGFSVLEARQGLRVPLGRWAEQNGYSLHVFGFGGHHLDNMPFILDVVSREIDLEDAIVLIDIQTSSIRNWFNLEFFDIFMIEMMRRIVRLKCRPAFLHLFRRDINYHDDFFIRYMKSHTDKYGIPHLDAASPLQVAFSEGRWNVDDYFTDVVHTTDLSCQYYADLISDFISNHEVPVCHPLGTEGDTVLFTVELASPPDVAPIRVDRHGVNLDFAAIVEGESMLVHNPGGGTVLGIYMIWGPQSGNLKVSAAGVEKVVPCFDATSYYPRLAHQYVHLAGVGEFRLETLPGLPDVALAKGQWDDGPRVNYVSHMLVRRD